MAVYYTDDITCWTPRMIWRGVRRTASPVLWLPLYCFFVGCKMFGRRAAASYGSQRPVQLHEIPSESLPSEVSVAFQTFISSSEAAAFRQEGTFETEYIGRKEGYTTILLHSDGYSHATVVWLRMGRGQLTRTKIAFSCHSQRTNGDYLDTGSLAPIERHPELIPPGFEFLDLGPDVPADEIIGAHMRRLDSERGLVRFEPGSLRLHLLVKTQTIFDYLISKGFYVPLTDVEVEHLKSQSASVGSSLLP